MFGNILGFLGLAAAGIGVVGSFLSSNNRSEALDNQAEQMRRAQSLEKTKNNVKEKRERMKLVREARIKRASAVAAATFQGAQGSVRGGFGSIVSQSLSSLQYLNTLSSLTGQQSIFYNEANRYALKARSAGEQASIFKGATTLGSTIFNKREDIAGFIR
tara:strand:+ start:54 stop:533 length:480 start_codon:yes stop_codon:yes gene_type:complete